MTTWEKWWFFAAILNYQKVHKNSANCFDHSDLHLIFGGPSHLTFSEIPPCHGHEGLAECYSTSLESNILNEAIKDLPRDEKVVSNYIWQLTIQESDEWPHNQNHSKSRPPNKNPVLSKDPCYKRNWFPLVSNTYKSSIAIHEMSQLEPQIPWSIILNYRSNSYNQTCENDLDANIIYNNNRVII